MPEKQDDAVSCYAKKLDKAMGLIDFDQSAVSIERLIRGLNPWPSAYTLYKGKTLKIWEADVVPLEKKEEPGTVVFVAKDFFDIATKEGALRVKSLQLEGKKKVAVKDFLLGYEIVCGMKF